MAKLLVVDDQPNFTSLVEIVFSDEYEVATAADGEEGLQKAAEFMPDIILLDIMMPKISGIEMLRRLQKDPATAKIPIIIVTASILPAAQESFRSEPNVFSLLNKLGGVEEMKAAVKAALAGRQPSR